MMNLSNLEVVIRLETRLTRIRVIKHRIKIGMNAYVGASTDSRDEMNLLISPSVAENVLDGQEAATVRELNALGVEVDDDHRTEGGHAVGSGREILG